MKRLAFVLVFLAFESIARAQVLGICGVVLLVPRGGGNVCPCGGTSTQVFVVMDSGSFAGALPGCAGSCNRYLPTPTACLSGVAPKQAETLDSHLFQMTIPQKLLMSSCEGGLYPMRSPAVPFEPGFSLPGQLMSTKSDGVGE